ncbi:MAG: PepSY domain-containing protein [Flavobacteriaceae bacterium]
MKNNTGQSMRIIHRYLGFFLTGIMAMYALSGMMMVYRNTDTFKRTVEVEQQLDQNLAPDPLGKALKIKGFAVTGQDEAVIYFKEGTYNRQTGIANYTVKKLPLLLDKMEKLHKATTDSPVYWLNLFFGASLLFFVVSSFWMFMPHTSVFKKGLYFSLAGMVLTVLLLFL